MLNQDNTNTRSTRTFDFVNTHLLTEALLCGWHWHGLHQNESLCGLMIPSCRLSWALSTSGGEGEETKNYFILLWRLGIRAGRFASVVGRPPPPPSIASCFMAHRAVRPYSAGLPALRTKVFTRNFHFLWSSKLYIRSSKTQNWILSLDRFTRIKSS